MENVIRERFSLSLICSTVRLFIFLYFKSVLNCVASRADLCCVRCFILSSANLRLRSAVVLKCRHKNPQKPSIIFVVCKKCDCATDSNSLVCCNFYCSQVATKYQKTWQSRAGLLKKAFLLQSFSLIANTNEKQSISPWYYIVHLYDCVLTSVYFIECLQKKYKFDTNTSLPYGNKKQNKKHL